MSFRFYQRRFNKQLTAAVFLLSAFLVAADAAERPPGFKSPITDGIQLTIRLSDYEYRCDEVIFIECWMTNRSGKNKTVCIFPFEFTFSAKLTRDGQNFFDTDDGYVFSGDFTKGIGDRKAARRDYIKLRPGESLRIAGEGRQIPLHSIIGRHLDLRRISIGPGNYNMTLRFSQRIFDGSEYGIRSWKTAVESNTVTLRVLTGPDIEIILKQLENPLPKIQVKAAAILGKMKNSRAVGPLIEKLEHTDTEVRLNAAASLGMIGDGRAVEPLIVLLKDENERVAEYAALASAKIGGKPAVAPLIERLSDESTWVRRKTLETLRLIPDPALFDTIAAGLNDEKRSVRYAALHALPTVLVTKHETRKSIAKSLISATTDEYFEIRGDAAAALALFGDIPGIAEPIMRLLKDDDSYVREKAVLALGKLRPDGVIEILLPALKDPDKKVRAAVIKALQKISGKPIEEIEQ